jgi:hypothetical protein
MDVRRQATDGNYAEAPAPRREAPGMSFPGNNTTLTKVMAVLFVLACVAVLGWVGAQAYSGARANAAVKDKQFQAVFLTNGQVYFGKFTSINNQYVVLTDIYYLQVQQAVQPKSGSSSSSSNQSVSLAKLGGELHGPEDQMFINRDQVLFWENLKNSGKVVQAILKYQNGSFNG